jgi:hypothetical protein
MDHREDREILRKGGFAEEEMDQLSRLRKYYAEREKQLAAIAHRRLEFVRWLVANGKLTEHFDQIA